MSNKKRRVPVVISCLGPSGAGKDTILKKLRVKYPELVFDPRYTTRKLRPGERQNIDYICVSDKRFRELEECGKIDKDTVHRFDGHLYGADTYGIVESLKNEKTVIGAYGRCTLSFPDKIEKPMFAFLVVADPLSIQRRLIEVRHYEGESLRRRLDQALRHLDQERNLLLKDEWMHKYEITNSDGDDHAVEQIEIALRQFEINSRCVIAGFTRKKEIRIKERGIKLH